MVFLTGKQEIQSCVRRLRKKFPSLESPDVAPSQNEDEDEMAGLGRDELAFDMDDAESSEEEGDGSQDKDDIMPGDGDQTKMPLYVLPLYSQLSSAAQLRVTYTPRLSPSGPGDMTTTPLPQPLRFG